MRRLLAALVAFAVALIAPAPHSDAGAATPPTTVVSIYAAASNTPESTFASGVGGTSAGPLVTASFAEPTGALSRLVTSFVAAETATDAASVGFRTDTTHIFRDAAGHFADDTAANRAIIRGAVDPANLRTTITLKDGSTLSTYFQTLPDGTQAWAEVRNGTEITNGGLNVIPR